MKKFFLLIFLAALIFFSCSKEDDKTQQQTNSPAPLPVACFTINQNEAGDSSLVFVFTNCSQNAVRYEWDFGDATYAPVANPIHYYNQYGTFIVHMTAYNSDNVASSVTDTIVVGHYSLDKIVYRQTTTRFATSFLLKMIRTGYFNITDTLYDQSFLPLTVQLNDSSIYDFLVGPAQYNYREDSVGFGFSRLFTVTYPRIINNQFDTALGIGNFDTAKFTLHYKVVPR
jgi:hypothetical protein